MVDSERKSRSAIRALLSPSPTRPSISLWREERMVRGEEGNPVYWQGILTDITERKTLEERLRHRAFHDSLTGLPNRPLFLELLQHALLRAARENRAVAILFFDLDDFKVINDSMGHAAGNKLLKLVAGRIGSCVRPEDTVAR